MSADRHPPTRPPVGAWPAPGDVRFKATEIEALCSLLGTIAERLAATPPVAPDERLVDVVHRVQAALGARQVALRDTDALRRLDRQLRTARRADRTARRRTERRLARVARRHRARHEDGRDGR